MKFTAQYPMQAGVDPHLFDPQAIIDFAVAAEESGFDAIAFTEHPAPSQKWLDSGGHESFDPLTVLAYVAAVTTRLRLMTYLLVLPYRNPLLAAKQATTVDIVSGGRLTIAAGSGYLRSEFGALGVDFEERNELFDEALEVMRGIWTTPGFIHEGRHFTARGQSQRPGPVQQPHPPFWMGGNSRKARRRAATLGQGWSPLLIDAELSQTTRTPPLSTPTALAGAVDELRGFLAEAGRENENFDIQAEWTTTRDMTAPKEETLDGVGQLADAGATWTVAEPPSHDAKLAIDLLRQYGADVIAASR